MKTKKRLENVNDNTNSYKDKILRLSRRINLDALYLAFDSEQFPDANRELDKVKTLLDTIKAHFEGLLSKSDIKTEPISTLNENHNNNATENEDFQFGNDDNDDDDDDVERVQTNEIETKFTPTAGMDGERIDMRSLLGEARLKTAVKKKVVAIPKKLYEKNRGFWCRHIENMLNNDQTNSTATSGNQLKDFNVIDWHTGIEPTSIADSTESLSLEEAKKRLKMKVDAGLNSLKAVSREGEFYFDLPNKPVEPEDTKTKETESKHHKTDTKNSTAGDNADVKPSVHKVAKEKKVAIEKKVKLRPPVPEKHEACVCEKCGHVAKTPKQLTRHMGIHDPNHQYRCAECGQECGGMEAYDLHMLTHPNHPTFMCEVCGKQYPTRRKLYLHTKACRKNQTKTKCHLCDKMFISMNSMRRHLDTAHMGRRYDCDICLKQFSTQYALKFHKSNVHDERLYQCNYCLKSFLRSKSLQNHHMKHNCAKRAAEGHIFKTEKKPILPLSQRANYSCSVCLRRFVVKSTFCQHMLRHEADNLRQCLVCNQVFTSFEQLKTHIMTSYLTGKLYKCKECPETFYNRVAYYKHKRRHVNEDMPFKCDECGKMLKTKATLISHKQSIHLGIKYNCRYCNREFNAQCNLKRHEFIHENPDRIKPFKCQVCGKDFAERTTLKNHMWTHSSVKRFHCDTCGEGFNERRRLLIHQKRQHPPTWGSDLRRQ